MPKSKRKPAKRHRPKPRKPAPAPAPREPTYAIVQHGRPRTLSQSEVDLIKKTCAKDATEDEFTLFMQVCKKSKLDPFLKQIYCVIFTGQRTGRQMVIITGIGGFRMMAARDHKDYGGTSDAVFTWPDPPMNTPTVKRKVPESATVTAYRKGGQAGSATAYWEEFAPADMTSDRADFWRRMPKHMLAKCAEALALRKMFPGLNNIFTEEEMSARLADFTEGGRQISVDGVAPGSGMLLNNRNRSHDQAHEDSQSIAKAKKDGTWCERHHCISTQCPSDEHSAGEQEAFWVAEQKAKGKDPEGRPLNPEVMPKGDRNAQDARNVTPKPASTPQSAKAPQAPPASQGPSNKAPIGDPLWPKRDSGKPEARPETKTASRGAEAGAKPTPAAQTLVSGTLHRTIAAMTSRNAPVLKVKINNTWYDCYKNTLHQYLTRGDGQVIEVYLDARKQIVGLKRIGRQEFQDGLVPVVQNRDREAGQKTLYP